MAAPPSGKAHGLSPAPSEVDLKPVMGLIVLLIPLLLYTFSFFQIRVSPVEVPKVKTAAGPGSQNQEKPLDLTIMITRVGFTIKMNPEVVGADKADINIDKKQFGKKKDYNYPGLYSKLLGIKKNYPKESLVHLTGNACVKFQTVVKVIDTIRFIRKEKSFKNPDEFLHSPIEQEERTAHGHTVKVPKLLFKQVDFVVAE